MLKAYSSEKPVIFVHVPKCAGTSFIGLLRRWFGETYHHPHQDESRDVLLPKVEVKLANGQWNPKIKCIHSHFDSGRGYGLPEHYPEVDQYFTVMRDPFDMIVSMYFFVKGRSERGEYRYRGKVIDIREQYPNLRSYLEVPHAWVEDHLPADLTVENCEDYVASRFVYLGRFEALQPSVDRLADVLGMQRVVLRKHNESTYSEEVPWHLKEWIYSRYPKAKRLHDWSARTYLASNRIRFQFPWLNRRVNHLQSLFGWKR